MIEDPDFSAGPRSSGVRFSITADAAWAPGIETREAWQAWTKGSLSIAGDAEPAVRKMPAMQRRRAGFLGRMALEVAYECNDGRHEIPAVFCSRHGDVSRSVDLLRDLASRDPLSPTSFGMSVHNAIGGMFSIARGDMANHIAISARESTIEHAVIEACGLLADGEKAVLLVAYDCPLPAIYADYQSDSEQPFAWAWLIEPPQQDVISLSWSTVQEGESETALDVPAGLQVLRSHLRKDRHLTRVCGTQKWQWSRRA
jgi:hypothetical protein